MDLFIVLLFQRMQNLNSWTRFNTVAPLAKDDLALVVDAGGAPGFVVD